MKIDRAPYADLPCVQKLVNANLPWNPKSKVEPLELQNAKACLTKIHLAKPNKSVWRKKLYY
jgi:hypothetical protein